MKNKCLPLLSVMALTILAGCQTPPPAPSPWTGMHLDQAQFLAQEKEFTCLAPTGVDFAKDGTAIRTTTCFKTQDCETHQRKFVLDAHTMLVLTAQESSTAIEQCTVEPKTPTTKE